MRLHKVRVDPESFLAFCYGGIDLTCGRVGIGQIVVSNCVVRVDTQGSKILLYGGL